VLHPITSASFVVVQKVPFGTLTPGSTGVPGGVALDPRCGVGVATTAATRAKAVMKVVERMMVEGGWCLIWWDGMVVGCDFRSRLVGVKKMEEIVVVMMLLLHCG